MEATLKRLVSKLCIAAKGLAPKLDDEIKKLQAAIRGEASSEALEQIVPALTDAIHALDHEAAPTGDLQPSNPHEQRQHPLNDKADQSFAVTGDERVRAIIAALLAELRRDPELHNAINVVDTQLATALKPEQLPDVLAAVAGIVGKRIKRIEIAKQEMEALMGQMLGKLDEISKFVADQNQNQKQSLASSTSFNTQLVGEMKAMGDSVASAVDLQQIRVQVRTRLDAIGSHLQAFQQREAQRATAISARNEQMGARVAELEAEASRLHHQLKDEQRLSSLDVLTQIPNRLAYDRRIEEELQRWQRFAQPTCVAAWDVDHFKRINDAYGHRAGDRVLQAVAECLATRIRSTDFVARYGGEEFAMILADTQLDVAMRLIDDIRLAIANLGFHFRGAPVSITISSGVTTLRAGDSAGSAFERADKALYQAKDAGRNRCVSL